MTPEELLALNDALSQPKPGGASPPPQPTQPKAASEFTPADLEALAAPSGPVVSRTSAPMTPDDIMALNATSTGTGEGASTTKTSATSNPSNLDNPAEIPSRYDAAGQIGGAIVTGAAKSIFETKDFIFGETPEAEKSDTRRSIEALDKELGQASMANSFVSNLSQFATGMLGAGKLVSAAKAVPAVGAAIGGLEASRKGAFALEAGKAAAVGAVAMDPNGPRLSDLVQKFPALQNPVTEFLASQPGDSRALGRVKNALESIGVDAALAGVFAASVAGFKALKGGDAVAIEATSRDLSEAVAHSEAKLAVSRGDGETLAVLRQEHPEAVAQAELASGTEAVLVPPRPAELPAAGKPDAQPAGQPVSAPIEAVTGTPASAPRAPLFDITDEQVARLIEHGRADAEQLLTPGGWAGAIEQGYRFGDGGRIPWQKFALEEGHAPGRSPLDQIIRRVSDEFAGEIAASKGGEGVTGVRSDALQDRLIAQRVAIYGDDPEALMGALQLAGRNADSLVADVAAADLVTLRAAQDAQNLADRIRLGMLEEYGGDLSAAMQALRAHYQVAATARAQSAAMVANAARTLRRQRAEFAYSLEDVAAMNRLSDAQMLNLIEAAGRDPRVADRLLRRGFWARVQDDASYLFVNNLLWGLRTHAVNLITNTYMVGARPLERMLGAAVQGDRARFAENARQYGYLASSLHESWRDALRTWQTGDSILAPHTTELSAGCVFRRSRPGIPI